jgi:hypothetical protein
VTTHAPVDLWIAVATVIITVSGLLTIGVLWTDRGRSGRRVLCGLAAWLALDVALGVAGAFATERHRLLPGIVPGIALPMVIGLWLLRRRGSLGRIAESVPLRGLIAVQVYRVGGAVFLVAWAQGRIPAVFALPAGLGDIAIGLTAIPVAMRVESAPRLAIAWNIAGIIDFAVAIALGTMTSPTPYELLANAHPNALVSRLPFVLIPTFGVPVSMLLHAMALRRLTAPAASSSPAALMPAAPA